MNGFEILKQASERLRKLQTNRRTAPNNRSYDDRYHKVSRKLPTEGSADDDEEMGEMKAAPRPTTLSGQDKSRERRMFAGLLGTLKQRDKGGEKEKEMLDKRKSIEDAASGKSEEISRELREAQYKAFCEKRAADEKVKFELDLKYKETERSYIEAQYGDLKTKLSESGAILTVLEPLLVYRPRNPTSKNVEAAQASCERLEQWRASQIERIENAIQTIHRRREEVAERRAKAQARGEEHDDVDVDDGDVDALENEEIEADEMQA